MVRAFITLIKNHCYSLRKQLNKIFLPFSTCGEGLG